MFGECQERSIAQATDFHLIFAETKRALARRGFEAACVAVVLDHFNGAIDGWNKEQQGESAPGHLHDRTEAKNREDDQGQSDGKPGECELLVVLHLFVGSRPQEIGEPAPLDMLKTNNACQRNKMVSCLACLQTHGWQYISIRSTNRRSFDTNVRGFRFHWGRKAV